MAKSTNPCSVYFLVNNAEDGEHVSRYATSNEALHALAMMLGREACTLTVGKRYVDDWGRAMRLETWGAGTTLADRKGYGRAYDARECGTLTKSQRALLARMEA